MSNKRDLSEKLIPQVKSRKNYRLFIKISCVLLYFLAGIIFYRVYEGWDWTVSVFFSVVTISTVGYGEATPSDDISRLFTLFYMIFGIYLIFAGIYEYANKQMTEIKFYFRDKIKNNFENNNDINNDHKSINIFNYKKKEKNDIMFRNSYIRIYIASFCIFLCVLIGALFFMFNEKWSFLSGLYFAVETSTTVGYGDLEIKYDSTRLFLCFYILISCCLIIYLINNINNLRLKKKEYKNLQRFIKQKQTLHEIINSLKFDNEVNIYGIKKFQFVLVILQHLKIVNFERHVAPWLKKFDEMDHEGKGILSIEQLEEFCKTERELSSKEMVEMVQITHYDLLGKILNEAGITHNKSNLDEEREGLNSEINSERLYDKLIVDDLINDHDFSDDEEHFRI